MTTMIADKDLEKKVETSIIENPHVFFREKDGNSKYISIKITHERYKQHSVMEIVKILNRVGDKKIYIHATPEKIKIEYNPKYWREIKDILKDFRYMFGNGYKK